MPQDNFTKWLKSQKSGNLTYDKKKFQSVQSGKSQVGLTKFPPMRSDTRLRLGTYKPVKKFKASKGLVLPENFNNLGGGDENPSANRKRIYDQILRPMNQYFCGSCYAVAVATTMSDVFTYGLGYNPNISALALMSCQRGNENNDGCGGGNPSMVIDEVEKNGLMTSFCLDYKTQCESLASCSKDYVHGGSEEDQTKVLNNELIPAFCGCCNISKTHYKYYIKNKRLLYSTSSLNKNYNNPDAVAELKEHIYNFGAGVGAYLIPQNWMLDPDHGKFKLTNGVYVESENYTGNTEDIPNASFSNVMGGHAVVVVGYGVEKNVPIPSAGITMDLPYWLIRNSWGEDWGIKVKRYNGELVGGYFKIAMYQPKTATTPEINPNIAFERENDLQGGIIIFDPAKVEKLENKKQVSCLKPESMMYQQNDIVDVVDIPDTIGTDKVFPDNVDVLDVHHIKNKNDHFILKVGIACVVLYIAYKYFK